ncbi:MAG: cellulase family glycosylhydrolase [Acidobacteria bacterium]|nr:cellulase family glycosylhydrolase [Acidobacteriota bacterium]
MRPTWVSFSASATSTSSPSLARRLPGIILTLLAASLLPAFVLPAAAITADGICAPSPITIGVNADFDQNLTRNAQIGWVRLNMRWNEINPAFGLWDFAVHDAKVNAAEAQGLKILAILSTAPQWAGGGNLGNTPPANTAYWQEYVQRVAQRYAGRIAAYEIWNEPNLENNGGIGIGWDRPLSQSPRYVDYLRIAAIQIRQYAPGTLVVGPATSSRPNARTVEVFQQIQNTNSSQYIDVVSFHANGGGDSSAVVSSAINSHLSTLQVRNPSNAQKPIWITEMGWRSGSVGESGQLSRTQGIIVGMTGSGPGGTDSLFCPAWTGRNFTHAFIFLLKDTGGETAGIYRSNNAAKQITTQYLQPKAFPATETHLFTIPITTSCVGRVCTFTSTFADPYNLYDFGWDFGDGVTLRAGHQVSHTYASGGWRFVKMATVFKGSTLGGGGDLKLIKIP